MIFGVFRKPVLIYRKLIGYTSCYCLGDIGGGILFCCHWPKHRCILCPKMSLICLAMSTTYVKRFW